MNYGEILSKAWKTIWKHKVLWIFGILASCSNQSGGGGGGGGGNNVNYQMNGNDFNNMPFNMPWLEDLGRSLERAANDGTIWIYIGGFILAMICLSLIISLIALALGTFGRIGLVRGTWASDEGAQKLTFGELWRGSTPYFWRVILFNVILWVFGIVIGLVAFFFALFTLGIGICLIIPLAIVIGWAITVITELTIVAIVGENVDVMEGIRRAWNLLRENLGPVILISLILGIGAGIIGFIIGLPVLIAFLPVILGAVSGNDSAVMSGIGLTIGLVCLYIPIAIFLGGVLQAYVGAAWTLTYRRLTGRLPADGSMVPVEPVAPAPVEPLYVNPDDKDLPKE